MEGQPNGSLSEPQDLVIDVTGMLQGVDLPEESGVHEQCIYRVPPQLRQVNQKAYTPSVVSIGPFHNPRGSGGDNRLEPMEDVKLKYLKAFLTRTRLSGEDFVVKLKEWEAKLRRCYSEPIKYDSHDFLRMILIDACFIIEHFLRFYQGGIWIVKDPLLFKGRLLQNVAFDLMLLENQLPFFVLENIYNLSGVNFNSVSFHEITFSYFRYNNPQNIEPEPELSTVRPLHFTDLLRTFVLPSSVHRRKIKGRGNVVEHLYSASQLWEAGLVFKVNPSKCLLDLKFDEGVLKMPCFTVQDWTEVFIRNIVVFEQCYHPYSRYITEYIWILDFLINTEKDVNILVDKKIIVNLLGDTNAVATMVNNLGINLSLSDFNADYFFLCNQLNGFYENPRNKYKAILTHEYFNTPWKIASTIAAVLLLFLTLIQTVCSVISLF